MLKIKLINQRFPKIESGKMELVPVKYELKQLIVDLVRTIGFRAESKGLELKLEVEETLPNVLYGDDVRIRQIILNILTNAVKYTKRGTVTLNVSGQKENDCIKQKAPVFHLNYYRGLWRRNRLAL